MLAKFMGKKKLIAELDPSMDVSESPEVRLTIQEMFETMLLQEQIVLTRSEKKKLFDQIVAEILGVLGMSLTAQLLIVSVTKLLPVVGGLLTSRFLFDGTPSFESQIPYLAALIQ